MDRRAFIRSSIYGLSTGMLGSSLLGLGGCRGRQVAHVLDDNQNDMVGSHEAGAETYNRLVSDAVAKLLGRECEQIQMVSHTTSEYGIPQKRICFVGVENKTIEELGDFREQIYELIDTEISTSDTFEPVSRRYVDSALHLTRLRPDQLFVPDNQREFAAVMEQQNAPFDYLLFAKLTSGTTENNHDYQRDYTLTLELVNIHTGGYTKELAKIRKGYHKTRLGKWRNYNPFKS